VAEGIWQPEEQGDEETGGLGDRETRGWGDKVKDIEGEAALLVTRLVVGERVFLSRG
jgi:hypothetical protein